MLQATTVPHEIDGEDSLKFADLLDTFGESKFKKKIFLPNLDESYMNEGDEKPVTHLAILAWYLGILLSH